MLTSEGEYGLPETKMNGITTGWKNKSAFYSSNNVNYIY